MDWLYNKKRLYKYIYLFIYKYIYIFRPPLWSSGQRFWLQIQRSRVRFPALPDFLSGSGSGTGSTQPREVKLRSYLNKKSSGSRFRKQSLTAVGIRCANHVTPLYPQKLSLTSPTGGGRSVGMVRSRTKATEFSLVYIYIYLTYLAVPHNYACMTGLVLVLRLNPTGKSIINHSIISHSLLNKR